MQNLSDTMALASLKGDAKASLPSFLRSIIPILDIKIFFAVGVGLVPTLQKDNHAKYRRRIRPRNRTRRTQNV